MLEATVDIEVLSPDFDDDEITICINGIVSVVVATGRIGCEVLYPGPGGVRRLLELATVKVVGAVPCTNLNPGIAPGVVLHGKVTPSV